VISEVSERLAMVVSRNDEVHGTGGRRGAREPQAAACGERGEPAPQVTSEAPPYGIL